LILEKSTLRSLNPARINPHKNEVKDVLSEAEEEDVEAEVVVVEVEVVVLFPVTTTTKEETTTTTLPTKELETITTTTTKEVATTTTTITDKDDVSLVDDSEEEEAQVTMEATKVETKEDKEVTTKVTKVELNPPEVVLTKVKEVLPEEDVLPDVNCPTELLHPPLCSLLISPSNSMMTVSPNCSKTKKSQKPTSSKIEMEDLKASVLLNSTMKLIKKQLWKRAPSCPLREEN